MNRHSILFRRGIAVLAVLMAVFVSASAHELKSIRMLVNLLDNGDAIIWDARQMYIGDEGTEIYIPIGNLNGSSVELLEVQDNGSILLNEGAWNVDRSRSQKAGKCGVVDKGSGGVEICWGLGSSGEHNYVAIYRVTNLLRGYADADGFNYMFVNPGIKPLPQSVEVEIVKAKISEEEYERIPLNADSVKMWGFRYRGSVDFDGDCVKATTSEPFSSESAMILMCRFDKGTFHPSLETDASFETLKNRALEGSDYGDNRTFWEKFWDEYIYYLIFVLLMFLPIVGAIYSWWKRRRFRKQIEQNLTWNREPSCKGNLKRSRQILRAMGYSGTDAKNLLGAYVLRMIYDGWLYIKDVRYTNGKTDQLLAIGTVNDHKHTLVGGDVYLQNKLFEIFKAAAGEDQILQTRELTQYMKRNASQLTSFVENLNSELSFSSVKKDPDEAREVVGLKKFLAEFTLSNERHVQEVTLWKDYLIFATLFGNAEQVRKDMKKLNPEFFRLDEITNKLDDNMVLLPSITNATMRGTDSIRNYISQREAQQQRSSGGGGFSSWGGGGGFSGGGIGGGVR